MIKAEKLQKRAAKSGFDWDDAKGAKDKIEEEMQEIDEVLKNHGKPLYKKIEQTEDVDMYDLLEDEIGDLLFATVNYIRLLGFSPEVALNRSNSKFKRRFSAMERLAQKKNLNFASLSLEEKDVLWEQVKVEEKK